MRSGRPTRTLPPHCGIAIRSMTAMGHKQTSRYALRYVRFTPREEIKTRRFAYPLSANFRLNALHSDIPSGVHEGRVLLVTRRA